MKKSKIELWKSPIYRFRISLDESSDDLKEIVFDVTGSAPPFEDVKESMKGVFEKFLKSKEGEKVNSIIDFGAAKLRNTLFFLNKGKKVCAVEFEELSKKSDQAKRIHKNCQKKKSLFEKWIFPYPFINHKKKYDMALLVNVLPVMPVFVERLLVLQLLYEKIKEDGCLMWYAQKEGTYKERREEGKFYCGDGVWLGDNKKFKTFFRYHTVEEVDEMMALSGFEFVKKFSSSGNDVRLYKKNKYNLLKDVLSYEEVCNYMKIDKTIKDPEEVEPKMVKMDSKTKEAIPNPSKFSIENLYLEILKNIKKGSKEDPEAPEKYHRVVSHILQRVFRDSLKNMEIKRDTHNGMKVIDTVYKNSSENGFFNDLNSKFQIKCPYILMEAKNYSFDPKNPEFDQLGSRLYDNIGKFGILACREIKDEGRAKEKCEGFLDDGQKHIIFLTDEDLQELLELSQDDDIEGINEFMDNKLRPIVFKSKK